MKSGTNEQSPKTGDRTTFHYLTNYDLFILVLTIFSMIVMVSILLPGRVAGQPILLRIDVLICIIFFVDFIHMWRIASNKTHYFVRKWGWLDLLGSIATVPGLPWTALLRLARLNRPVQMFKQQREERTPKSRESPADTVLMMTILIALLLLTITSLLVLRFERGAEGARILTGAEAFWWAFVTMTTVGYGDFVPVTTTGRVLAMGLMTFGIGVFAVLTSFLATKFAINQDEQTELAALIKEENARLHAEIAELRALITEQRE